MKVYTKTGDKGETSLLSGRRVSKSDIHIEAYGTIDELNSFIGLLRDQNIHSRYVKVLIAIQNKLFSIGSILASAGEQVAFVLPEVTLNDIKMLEYEMDEMDATLPPLKNFVLPGGHQAISLAHVCRTICRRAERKTIELKNHESVHENIIQYLNRLSDFFFVLSRKLAADLQVNEIAWVSANN